MIPGNMAEYSIGLDLGGTNLRAAAIDRSGMMLDKISGETEFSGGPRRGARRHRGEPSPRCARSMATNGLAGIGVGVPGFIRMKEGVITGSNNLPFLENFPVRDELSRRLGTKVILENDANAAALGEQWIGAGRGVDDLVLLTLGTGIGGGIICGGRIVRGSVGMAGEFGHISVVVNGNPCGCGNQGCLEKHASASAVTAMAKLMRLGDALSSKDVYDLAKTDGRDRRQGAPHLEGGRRSARPDDGDADQHLQLSAVSAERRHAAGVGAIRAAHDARGERAIVHLPRHADRDADRAGDAGQRGRTLRRGLLAVD